MSQVRNEFQLRLFSFLGWGLIQLIGHTIRFDVRGYERVLDMMNEGRGFILALWHGRTMLPIYYCRGKGIWAITALSRDGELQTNIVSRFGYRIIRGSTGRGGIKAALIAAKKIEEGGVLSITPDGPLGPAHEVQEGTVFLAERTRCPIIPIGTGMSCRKLLGAWDRYAVPMPFCRCGLIFGEPIDLSSPDLKDDGRSATEIIKAALNKVQRDAEDMVKEGR